MRIYEHQASAASGDEGAGQLFNKNYFKIVDLTAFKYVNIRNFLKYLYEFTARSPVPTCRSRSAMYKYFKKYDLRKNGETQKNQ